MPGCAAIGCNNRSEKGYSMKCFPRDPLLRQMWKKKVGRANWEPSKNSFLCHDHFEADQFMETEKGKLRLRRDAMPSIFNETSTRKSPRKRRLEDDDDDNTVTVSTVNVIADESEDENYTLEYLDDCEYEVAFSSVENSPETNCDKPSKGNVGYRIVSEKDICGLEKDNIIIVSEQNNKDIGKLVNNNESIIIVADENNKEIGQIIIEDNLIGRCNSGEDNSKQQDDYDDIEEKLKQICNGEEVTVTLTNLAGKNDVESRNSLPNVGKEKNVKSKETAGPNLDKEIPGNIKIIFGDESDSDSNIAEHKTSVANSETPKKTFLKKKELSDKSKTLETRSGDLNHSSLGAAQQKGETTVQTRLKKQKKSRENVMRSIERAVAELSKQTLRSAQNDQLTRSVVRIARARKKGNTEQSSAVTCAYKRPSGIFELDDCSSLSKKSKFTIKVTGGTDDVSEILEGLESSSMKIKTDINRRKNSSPKYVVAEEINERDLRRIDSRFIKGQERSVESFKSDQELSSDFDSIDSVEEENHRRYEKRKSNQMLKLRAEASDTEALFRKNKEFDAKLRRRKLSSERNGRIRIKGPNSDNDDNKRSMRVKYFSKSQSSSKELQQKISAQQKVIGKLTNQLIIYKGLEVKLANANIQLQAKAKEIKMLKDKLEKKSQLSAQDESDCQGDANVKDKTISDLSNKVNRLKEANKKLMQQIIVESQIKKSTYQLKQKDDMIKELNWKLEKASKFLDRAEKNANTYKRKMVNMQTSIRRQKASEKKRNHFQDLLIDNAKHDFSESAMITAMEIKNTCGIKCYRQLLSYNFPLPSLRTLRRRFQNENGTEDDWGEDEEELVASPGGNSNKSKNTTETCRSSELGESEITGTVQDIFEENNDAEELNSSELGDQIFLQLENDKKFAET